MKKISCLFALILLFSGCVSHVAKPESPKITRVFCWGIPRTEAEAAKYAAAGATDIRVTNQKQLEWVQKYGMTAYCGSFIPAGPHPQVLSPDEEIYHNYINGLDLGKNIPAAERKRIIENRRIEKKHRYGGDMVTDLDTVNVKTIACFGCDEDLKHTKLKIDRILAKAPAGVKGIFIDYLGYLNHRGCYCTDCVLRCLHFLRENKLADTPENRALFYRKILVDYYNAVVDHVKSRRPEFKVVAHIYPEFKPDPLYGNRTKVDFCGQTVSWYFQWQPEVIRHSTSVVINEAQKYFPQAQGIPFIGINTNAKSSLGYKTPEDVAKDIECVIAAGADTLMVCSGSAMITPGYFEVFKRYCGR